MRTTSDDSVFFVITAGLSGCCAVRYRHPEGFLVYGETLSMRRKEAADGRKNRRSYGLEWSKGGIFRTKVDEKVDNSGWRIKIVADGGYTHQIVGQKVGARWSPFFPRQSLARRHARKIVQVHAYALNGSWECYHVVRIGLGTIWGDHGRRRSLHFTTTPHFV